MSGQLQRGATPLSKHLVIMAAGTGGHVIPGLAVAREMQSRGWSVSWLGTTHGMENKLVPPSGIPMDNIVFSGLRGKGGLHTIFGVFRLVAALGSCWQIMRRRGTDVVLGMGGYVCFPGGVVAWLLRRPLMLVNADATLLLSNKALFSLAARVAFGFDGGTAGHKKRSIVTGNPVRAEIEAIAPPAERFEGRSGPLRVLLVGGSLGAKVLNETLPQAVALLPKASRPQITHQTGQAHHESVSASYASLQLEAEVLPFIDNMAERLATCDVIICRAGAVTISELCAAGVASVLVPFVASTTGHQHDNAQWMARQSAGIHLAQADLSPRKLADLLTSLTREALLALATKARSLARPHAAARVADELEKLVLA